MKRIPLSAIAFDAGTQVRVALDQDHVSALADAMTDGAAIPPITLFHDGNTYYIADGFHRYMAAQRVQWREIDAEVHAGARADALWFALGANRTNGKNMTPADKKHAIVLAITAWPDKSAATIAAQLGVSHVYVTRIRQQEFTTQDLPSRVVGRDGKTYPAKRDTPVVIEERRDEQREAIAAMVRQGRPSKDIIAELRVRPETVATVRRTLGVGIDNTKESVAKRRKDIREMAERGFTTRQIAAAVGIGEQAVGDIAKAEGFVIHADRVVGKSKRHDSDRIVGQMAIQLESMVADIDLVDIASLDPAQLGAWITAMKDAQKALGAFIRKLEQEHKKHVEAA